MYMVRSVFRVYLMNMFPDMYNVHSEVFQSLQDDSLFQTLQVHVGNGGDLDRLPDSQFCHFECDLCAFSA